MKDNKSRTLISLLSSCLDSRMTIPLLLWATCFAGFYVLLILNAYSRYGYLVTISFILITVLLVALYYISINGTFIAMAIGAWKEPLVVEDENGGTTLKVNGQSYHLPENSIARVNQVNVRKRFFTLGLTLSHEKLDDFMQSVTTEHRKQTGFDLTIGFPYFKSKHTLLQLLNNRPVDVIELDHTKIPYGMRIPKPLYIMAGMTLNFVVLYFVITRGVNI